MESMDKKRENFGGRSSEDPREKWQQDATLSPEELEKKTQSEKNDLLNEDPDEERREIEKSSEDNLESAE